MKMNSISTQSPVRFVLTNPYNSRLTIIGYADGTLKVVSLETLKADLEYRIPLDEAR
jgi:hypothetical protein